MNDPQPKPKPALPPYMDRPDCVEVFSDTICAVRVGDSVRIEFSVQRFDPDKPATLNRRVPVARVVIERSFLGGVRDYLTSLLLAIEGKGQAPAAPASSDRTKHQPPSEKPAK